MNIKTNRLILNVSKQGWKSLKHKYEIINQAGLLVIKFYPICIVVFLKKHYRTMA